MMWKFCLWFLYTFPAQLTKKLARVKEPPVDWSLFTEDYQKAWEREVTPPTKIETTTEVRTGKPRTLKILNEVSFIATYDPAPVIKEQWEVGKTTWPDGSVTWTVFWSIPKFEDNEDPLIYTNSTHKTEEEANKVAEELNNNE